MSAQVLSADGVVSKPSRYSVDETVKRLEEVVRGKGFTVFTRIDHRAGAREVGLEHGRSIYAPGYQP